MLNKRYKKSLEKVDKDKIYNLDQGLQLLWIPQHQSLMSLLI